MQVNDSEFDYVRHSCIQNLVLNSFDSVEI